MSFTLGSLFDQLYDAEYRGIPFHMPDVREETGRRVLRVMFPGVDEVWHEDLGALDGAIEVSGLIIGEDYIRRAERLRAAFRQEGPGLLTHPWLGDIDVVLARPAEISFSDRELRLARFRASFEPFIARPPVRPDTLGLLLLALDALREGARRVLRAVLAPVRLALAVTAATAAFADGFGTLFRSATGALPVPRPVGLAVSGLGGVGALAAGPAYADAVADRLLAPPAALREAATPAGRPGVAPFGGGDPLPLAIEGPAAARALLVVVAGLRVAEAPALAVAPPGLRLAAASLVLAEAMALGAAGPFAARDEAEAMRGALDAAAAALAGDAAALAQGDPGGAGRLWRDLADARAALLRDLSERWGRLPATATLLLPGAAPTWLVANHLAGDRPAALLAQHRDLVRRNRPRRPGLLPAGPVQVLR